MKYPENERILVVRPCLKTFCLGNKPASKLLSLLLYYARHCSDDESEFVFMSTQEALAEDLLDEIDVKTLHRTAIPMLKLLGFLDVDGASYRYQYTVHLDLIQHLLANYKDKQLVAEIVATSIKEQLDKLPIEQKDTFPIVYERRQLDILLKEIDKCPIQLDKLPIELEKCLIPFRQMSNSKRGRKPRPQAAWSNEFPKPQMDRDITDRYESTRGYGANAPTPSEIPSEEDDFDPLGETVPSMPAIRKTVTPVTENSSDSQPVYTQGEDDGHLPATAHPDVDSDAPEHCMDSQGASDGQLTPTQQTVPISPFTTGATSALGSPGESGSLRGMDELHGVTKPSVSKTLTVTKPAPNVKQPPLNLREDTPNVSLTKKQQERLLDRRADDLLALYCALMGDKITRSKENVGAMRELAQDDRSDEEVTLVMRNILDDHDQFLAKQLTPRKFVTNFTARLRAARSKPTTNGKAPTTEATPPDRQDWTGAGKKLREAREAAARQRGAV